MGRGEEGRTGQGRAGGKGTEGTHFSQRCTMMDERRVETLKIVIRYREMFFHYKSGQTLPLFVQRACGISVLNYSKLTWT